MSESATMTGLLNEAFRVLQHDTGEHDREYVFMRSALKKAFAKVLGKNAAQPAAVPVDGAGIKERDYSPEHYTAEQKAWCRAYERESGFEPMLDDYESGEKSFCEIAKFNVDWYESHSTHTFRRVSDLTIPGDLDR